MTDLAKSDAFFFITTIAVILVTIVVIIVAVYLIKILRDVKHISDKAKTETDLIAEDINELRTNVRRQGVKVRFFTNFINKLKKKHK